jgi:hypothetical protein
MCARRVRACVALASWLAGCGGPGPGAAPVVRIDAPRPVETAPEAARREHGAYYAGVATLVDGQGNTSAVQILIHRVSFPELATIEERAIQSGPPVIPCLEYVRKLVRKGNRLTVTEPATGLSGQGVQEEETQWSWEGTLARGTRITSVAKLTSTGGLHIVNKGFDAYGNPTVEVSGDYLPIDHEEFQRRRDKLRAACRAPAPSEAEPTDD